MGSGDRLCLQCSVRYLDSRASWTQAIDAARDSNRWPFPVAGSGRHRSVSMCSIYFTDLRPKHVQLWVPHRTLDKDIMRVVDFLSKSPPIKGRYLVKYRLHLGRDRHCQAWKTLLYLPAFPRGAWLHICLSPFWKSSACEALAQNVALRLVGLCCSCFSLRLSRRRLQLFDSELLGR